MQNPANTSQLNPKYDSGDHLHPNAAGYSHMADCTPIASTFGTVRQIDIYGGITSLSYS